MVQSFGGGSKANPALLVGLLIAVFTFSEFISATIWAKVSESIGRKWTLLIGVFGAMASAFFFGLSRSIYVAVAIRAFGGLANPNVGVVQTCVGEIVKDKGHLGDFLDSTGFINIDMLTMNMGTQRKHSQSCRFCVAWGTFFAHANSS